MALTSYNGYDCAKDRRRLFTPEDLESMAAWDAKIEADFSNQLAESMRGYKTPTEPAKKRCDKPLTPEQKAKKNARNRAYHAAHRYEISVKSREWERNHREQCRARSLAYYEAHREEVLAKNQARRAVSKEVKPCSPPPSDTQGSPG